MVQDRSGRAVTRITGFGAAVLTLVVSGFDIAAAQSVDDHVGTCWGQRYCEASLEAFRVEFPKALEGDYQSQRNVAFCLETSCDGAARKNLPLGCAWRIVILASGNTRVEESDMRNFKLFCENKLSATEAAVARAQAATLFQRIYNKPIPTGF